MAGPLQGMAAWLGGVALVVGTATGAASKTGQPGPPEPPEQTPGPEVEAAPASDMTVTVSPASGLRDGDQVIVEVSGYPAGPFIWLYQCGAELPADATDNDLYRLCTVMGGFRRGPDAGPVTLNNSVREIVQVDGSLPPPHQFHCGDEPQDCSIVAAVEVPYPGTTIPEWAAAPIDMVASPLSVSGYWQSEPEGRTYAWLSGIPGTRLSVAQCLHHPGVQDEPDRCIPGPDVVLSPTGHAATSLVVAPTMEVGGRSYDCLVRTCQLVVFDAAGDVWAVTEIPGSWRAGEVTLDRTTGLEPGTRLTARAWSNGGTYLALCLAAVVEGTIGALQGCRVATSVGDLGDYDIVVDDVFTPEAGGEPVSCRTASGGCVVALGTEQGVSWFVPIDFADPLAVAVSPADGLVDGQAMTVEATGLTPGASYTFVRCGPSTGDGGALTDLCEAEGASTAASPDGTASTTVTAAQALATRTYCRDRCSVALLGRDTALPVARAGYRMAEGSLAVAPSQRLEDGQAVTVTGTEIMASYEGPPWWVFPTGAWALTVCDAAVLDDPSLVGVFTHCAAPTEGPVAVPASTFTGETRVDAEIDRILGGSTDCRAAPGACAMVLTRLELDGSVSLHAAQLAFAVEGPGQEGAPAGDEMWG